MKKTLVIKLEDKEITIPFTKNDNEWTATISDECMFDICTFYSEIVRDCE